ncbi:MAG: hypothetical protein PHX30_01410 [Candidatus Pacebacteria bacterium]|jgi:hypothetical protein|nr:hypothetical protein [Candidatus Paceibacterota bacterium]
MILEDDIKDFLQDENSLSEKYVENFLRGINIFSLGDEERIIKIVQLIAEIPWGEGRSIKEVLVTKKVGTCTGKHLVLQACFDQLGIKYTPIVCTFRWSEQGIKLPDHLKFILDQGEWDHGHNFVQIEKANGIKVDIDLTWNHRLKRVGFITIPDEWDGETPVVAVRIKERWKGVDVKQMKVKLIELLSPEMRERRGNFMNGFIDWIDVLNK